MKRILLIIYCIIQAIGTLVVPLIMRLYFIHGGNRIWLSCFLQTAAFPVTLLQLSISNIHCRCIPTAADRTTPNIFSMKPLLFVASAVIGILTGLDGYLLSYGAARLPVSTSSLILATQLTFTAIFAFLLVRQKFTSYSVNSVVLLTLASGVLALHGTGDHPAGESSKQYAVGFVITLMAALLNGFISPLLELVYKKAKLAITYTLVLQVQLVVGLFATLFCAVGMIINNDFKVIPREARHFGLGEANYYVLLVGTAISSQVYFLGVMGVIFYASALFSGITIAMLLPVIEVLSVIFYDEKFHAEKGLSLVLAIWGSVSYFYGEFKEASKLKKNNILEAELPQNHSIPNP